MTIRSFKEFCNTAMPKEKTYPDRHPFFRFYIIYIMQWPGAFFSYPAYRLGFTPNGISAFRVFICLATPFIFLSNEMLFWVIGLLALYFALISDCIDGQVARAIKNNSGLEGTYIDSLTSGIISPSCTISPAVLYFTLTKSPIALIIASLTIAIEGLSNYHKYIILNKQVGINSQKTSSQTSNSMQFTFIQALKIFLTDGHFAIARTATAFIICLVTNEALALLLLNIYLFIMHFNREFKIAKNIYIKKLLSKSVN